MPTTKQEIQALNFVNLLSKLRSLFTKIDAGTITKGATIVALGNTIDLSTIAATYTDLGEARASVNTLRTDSEARLVALEAKMDEIITALKLSGVIVA